MKKNKIKFKDIFITSESTPFQIVEAYKTLRTNLMFALATSERRTIVVNSTAPSEGKSTIAINLSLALAEANHKTLLIDGDLRKPVLHKRLKLKNQIGLSNILAGFSEVEEATIDISEHLHVISAGEIPPNPSELLGSAVMEQFLRKMERQYDFIIIDSPPSLIVTDALTVAPLTAGIVLVVREGSTLQPDVEKVLAQMEFAGIKVLGLVLNAAGARNKGNGYYKNYHYSYRQEK